MKPSIEVKGVRNSCDIRARNKRTIMRDVSQLSIRLFQFDRSLLQLLDQIGNARAVPSFNGRLFVAARDSALTVFSALRTMVFWLPSLIQCQ